MPPQSLARMEQRNTAPEQENWAPALDRFFKFIKTNCAYEVIEPGNPDSSTPPDKRPFMPTGPILAYFEKNNYFELHSILQVLFPNDPINSRDIIPNYTRVFCILLHIGKGRYIKQFRHYDKLSDSALLPLDPKNPPGDFPHTAGDKEFLQDFDREQGKFCVPVFEERVSDRCFTQDRILPIVFKERLAGGEKANTANLWLVKLHPEYNNLIPESQKQRLGTDANTFVLKEYCTGDAIRYYENETAAFERVGVNEYLIGYYGSFRRGDTYNVLLEYADQGNLQEFFEKRRPPSTGENIIELWGALLRLLAALVRIHNIDIATYGPEDPLIFQGWHQDVRPANILVVSNGKKEVHEWTFKLADLGISHFHKTSIAREDSTANDSYGTGTYGAPECFRPDQIVGQTKLKVCQNVDIWSLGCVFSEVIRWMPPSHGYSALLDYREERKAETKELDIEELGAIDCFHDGHSVLEAVRSSHENLDDLHRKDYITEKVIDMVNDMLVPARERPTALELYREQLRIIGRARKKLAEKSATPNLPAPGDALSRPNRNQTAPVLSSNIRAPPVLPPERTIHSRTVVTPPAKGRADPDRSSTMMLKDEGGVRTQSPDSIDDPTELTEPSSPSPKITRHRYGRSTPPPHMPNNVLHDNQSPKITSQDRFRGSRYFDPTYSDPPWGENVGLALHTNTHNTAGVRQDDYHRYWTDQGDRDGRAPPRGTQAAEVIIDSPSSRMHFEHVREFSNRAQGQHHLDGRIDNAKQELREDPFDQWSKIRPNSVVITQAASSVAEYAPKLAVSGFPHLSINQALDWKRKCKSNKGHDVPLNIHLQNRLRNRDHVFLVDDSKPMVKHWPEVSKVFEALSYITKKHDNDGIDLYFTNSTNFAKKRNDTEFLIRMVEAQKQASNSMTDINMRLTSILTEYTTKLSSKWRPRKPNPLSLYVLTDGVWEGECTAKEPITNAVQKLQDLRKDKMQIGIQFISFGHDPKGLDRLLQLDEGLGLSKDIVDTEPSDRNVWKMLLGHISEGWD